MSKGLLIFEDEFQKNLNPLTYTRPIYDLRCGILTLREKIEKRFKDHKIFLHTRDYLSEFTKRNYKNESVNVIDESIKVKTINKSTFKIIPQKSNISDYNNLMN